MSLIVACSRQLPLPPIEAGGQKVEFVATAAGDPIPGEAVAYLATAIDPVDAALIGRMPPSLGLIANLGVGTDNIDLDAAAARGIAVSNTPVVTEDTADHAFALILAACRRIGQSERYLRLGDWERGDMPPPLGMRVHGAVLGLVGFGAIAQAVARRAAGFGMKVCYHSRAERPEEAAGLGAEWCPDLADLLSRSDIVSLHAPLTDATRGMIGAEQFSQIKQGAVLVNTARGALIDEVALIEALGSGHLSAAGLDVFIDEPRVSPKLLAFEQVVLTPHIGSGTMQCRTDMVRRGLGNIAAHLAGGAVPDLVTAP